MRNPADTDLTLPSVAAALAGSYREEQLLLTVEFHPDTSRIGEVAVLPRKGGPWTLGRLGPLFSRQGADHESSLDDPHVSRQAVRVCWQDASLAVNRVSGSSRCRLAGRELQDQVTLGPEQLATGVPVMLGHSVVLLLRLCATPVPADHTQSSGEPLVGSSGYMASLHRQIRQVADTDLDVLIRGETGTGKELVAGAIHRASRRAGAPLITVNMSAIPTALAAAALFGSARGAFTGAVRAGEGYFQQAEGGSLFLDEIGDAPLEIQPQLLRALQQREVQTVGGRVARVDLRVLSATDATLEGADCDFKSALRHRLAASEILLQPLRDHPEDIGELLCHFLVRSAEQLGRPPILPAEGAEPRTVAAWAELFYRFLGYHWPGNVRELENFARQVVLASAEGVVIPQSVADALKRGVPAAPSSTEGRGNRPMGEVADREFDQAMEENGYEVAPAARQMRVSRQSVYRRLEASPRHRLATQIPLEELQSALSLTGGDAVATAKQLRVSASGLRARLRGTTLDWR